MTASAAEYAYTDTGKTYEHGYLVKPALQILSGLPRGRLFDLGCGNGAISAELSAAGFSVTAVDVSESGIANAKLAHPDLDAHVACAYDDLASRFGKFPVVVSFEVIEHLYDPRSFARSVYDLLEPGGLALISTPYHGYLKNLAIALANGFDAHWSPLWDHGHIKFWSVATITQLLNESGFTDITIERAGRIPALAKSMIVTARKPT